METSFIKIFFCLLLVAVVHEAGAQQVSRSLTAANGEKIGFLESRPENYGNQLHPLIIFLHGIDERGNGSTEISRVSTHGIPKLLKSKSLIVKGNSFVVLSPQLDKKYGAWDSFYIEEMLKYARTLHIDTNRIYLTGLSLGGGAVWGYTSVSIEHAKKFAAIVPIAAVCYYDYQKLVNIAKAGTPVWAFVGESDKVVTPLCTMQAVGAVNAYKPAVPAKATVYTKMGHNVWDRAYDTTHKFQNPNVYEWMLHYSRQTNNEKNKQEKTGH